MRANLRLFMTNDVRPCLVTPESPPINPTIFPCAAALSSRVATQHLLSCIPLPAQTLARGLAAAVDSGMTRAVGVSNYSEEELRETHRVLAEAGVPLALNQVSGKACLHAAAESRHGRQMASGRHTHTGCAISSAQMLGCGLRWCVALC